MLTGAGFEFVSIEHILEYRGVFPMKERIGFTLNGKRVEVEVDGDRALLWVLRTDLGLTGTKYGCGESYCGACTVLVDDSAVRSCQTTVKEVRNKNVVTIEGLANGNVLHPLQKAFADNDAMQCGYCTPGMILNAYALLKRNPEPSEADILEGMEDNLCRCGAHKRIVDAIRVAAQEMRGF
jgi:aerobic-type carbon monoxide dehydrogenase small subunit (CoxS/CutS family)